MGGGLRLQLPSNPFAHRRRAPVPKLVLYRGKGMLLFRFVVRAKVFQLMGFLAAAAFASAVISTVRGLAGRAGQEPVRDGTEEGWLAWGCGLGAFVPNSYFPWWLQARECRSLFGPCGCAGAAGNASRCN